MTRADDALDGFESQADDTIGPLDPFLILRKRDNSFAVAARAEDGVIYVGPLRIVPDPIHKRLFECPCCGRGVIMTEWPDGALKLEPLSPTLHDDDGDKP
jgi:hypothetical protein